MDHIFMESCLIKPYKAIETICFVRTCYIHLYRTEKGFNVSQKWTLHQNDLKFTQYFTKILKSFELHCNLITCYEVLFLPLICVPPSGALSRTTLYISPSCLKIQNSYIDFKVIVIGLYMMGIILEENCWFNLIIYV